MKKYKSFIHSNEWSCKECGARNTYFLKVWNGKKWCMLRKCQTCVNEDRRLYYYEHRDKVLVRQRKYDRARARVYRGENRSNLNKQGSG